jgi:signal transduction histidine kinase
MISLARRVWRAYACYGIWTTPGEPVPPEVLFLRLLGLGYFVLIIVGTTTTSPHPGLSGRGLGVLLALMVLVAAILLSNPRSAVRPWTRVGALAAMTVAAAVLAAIQPNGLWEATPYYVAIVAAMRLDRRVAPIVLGLNLVILGSVAGVTNKWGQAVGTLIGAVPWFLVMRQMRRMREQNLALEASQAAEARAAAAAERGRLAREMHDVLAHTLSALALQLESTRLLAHDRGVDPDVSRAIDQAHGLAASGLDEARRAIGAARGDALPGPERVHNLAAAVAEQSGLPVTVDVSGEPRELPADARLAVYRTAQEALTNVRRHATPDRVEVRLDYQPDAVALVVEDHGVAAVGAGAGAGAGVALGDGTRDMPRGEGYGLTGMRERAELLGGTLVAEPTHDGFRVQLVLPA